VAGVLVSDASELARCRRLFDRLENAISHHKREHDSGRYFADDPDEALWAARDKILRDYAGRNFSTQRQDSVTAQMQDLLVTAVEMGCYDAADWIDRSFFRERERWADSPLGPLPSRTFPG
jgi:hypothetical protein